MKEPEKDPQPGATNARSRRRTACVAATVVAIVLVCALALRGAFLVDDAYITFRFARSWVELGSPVFNAFELAPGGEPVEGYSNFLWVAALAALHALGGDLPTAVGPLQLGIVAVTLGLVGRFAATALGLGTFAAACAPLLLATSAPFVAWSSGGMETTLFTALLTAFALGALRPGGEPLRRGILLGGLGAGVALVRVEGAVWTVAVLGAVALGTFFVEDPGEDPGEGPGEKPSENPGESIVALRRERRRVLVAVALIAAALVAHLVWRAATYGSILPNTVTAKTGGGADVMGRGAAQVASWALVTVTPLAALWLALPACRHSDPRARRAALSLGILVLGFAAYNVLVGGDWMPFFRFLAPVAPALALFVAIGLDRLRPRLRLAAALFVLVAQPLALFDVHLAPESTRESVRFRAFRGGYRSEADRVVAARANEAYFGRLGHALAQGTRAGDILAFGAIGSPGWFAPHLDFVDRNGLVTPEVAAREVEPGVRTAGHEKRVAHAWFLDHGSPPPNYLFATWLEGRLDPTRPDALRAAKASLLSSGLLPLPAERELFERTVLRVVPIEAGPAAGCTLLLLERSDRASAVRFWGG